MDIKDILSVGLTAEDFDTCIDGLDAIPEKGLANEVMQGILGVMLGGAVNDCRRKEMEAAFRRRMKEQEIKIASGKEDLVILKSKLILLKRLLISNAAVNMTNEILNPPPSKVIDYQLAA